MPNSQLLGAANQLAGGCGCLRSPQLCTRSVSALRVQDASRRSTSATPCQAAETQHASPALGTGLDISQKHGNSEGPSCREGPQILSSQESWELEQLDQRHISKQGHGRKTPQAGLWSWEWGSTRWRASFFFLMASVAFVIGSAASLQHHLFAGVSLSDHANPRCPLQHQPCRSGAAATFSGLKNAHASQSHQRQRMRRQ